MKWEPTVANIWILDWHTFIEDDPFPPEIRTMRGRIWKKGPSVTHFEIDQEIIYDERDATVFSLPYMDGIAKIHNLWCYKVIGEIQSRVTEFLRAKLSDNRPLQFFGLDVKF